MTFFEVNAAKIEIAPSGCWLWTAGTSRGGYGKAWIAGKNVAAHRAAYEAKNGKGSALGLVVRHRCDTPSCVNPLHLEVGSQGDNIRDAVSRGRNRPPRGERNASAKLTYSKVAAIRERYIPRDPKHGQAALARELGVNLSTISSILRRDSWASV